MMERASRHGLCGILRGGGYWWLPQTAGTIALAAHTLSSHSHTLSTSQTNRLVAAKLTILKTVEVAEVKRKNVECAGWLTPRLLLNSDWKVCIFLHLPFLLFSLVCSSLCPHTPPLHCHNPPCLWQLCMKWILPHPAGKILISLLLYLCLLSTLSS